MNYDSLALLRPLNASITKLNTIYIFATKSPISAKPKQMRSKCRGLHIYFNNFTSTTKNKANFITYRSTQYTFIYPNSFNFHCIFILISNLRPTLFKAVVSRKR